MVFFLPVRRGNKVKPHRRNPHTTRLQVEVLEDRSLLSAGYSFQALAVLGGNAPPVGGGNDGVTSVFDFEPGEINNRGQVVFGNDLSSGGEGVFITDAKGHLTTLARAGDTRPEGNTFGPVYLGTATNNDGGDAAFAIQRGDFDFATSLLAVDASLYRYTPQDGVTVELAPGAAAPGGGTFHGYNFRPSLNNGGTIAFSGLIETTIGPGNPGAPNNLGLGFGIFTVDSHHHVSKVVRPGDSAPGGKIFDFAVNPWINDNGDVVFGGHVKQDPFIQFGATFPAGNQIFTGESTYVWNKQNGQITEIARQNKTTVPGDPGFKFNYAFGPQINNRGDATYFGAYGKAVHGTYLIPGDGGSLVNNTGIFLWSNGTSVAVAKPGDAMPGGGHMISAGSFTAEMGLNNNGLVTFTATLDTDANGDGFNDTGLYAWDHGSLSLIARSGTVLPGIGTIAGLHPPAVPDFATTFSGAANNDRGQVVFGAALTNGDGVMLLATPKGDNHDGGEASAQAHRAEVRPTSQPANIGAMAGNSAVTDLSGVAVARGLSSQNATHLAEVTLTSQPVDAEATAGNGSIVVIPSQARTSPAPASSSAAKTSHHSAVDDFFATIAEGFWEDPLA